VDTNTAKVTNVNSAAQTRHRATTRVRCISSELASRLRGWRRFFNIGAVGKAIGINTILCASSYQIIGNAGCFAWSCRIFIVNFIIKTNAPLYA
jgi:hypothetical protein